MTTTKISYGTYEITENGRTFQVDYDDELNEWKIYEGYDNWWETVTLLRDAKEYIKELVK